MSSTELVPVEAATKSVVASTPSRSSNSLTILDLAKHAFASGMFKKLPNASAAVMILQLGRDVGVSDTAALTSIHFFEGKPTMSGNMLWGLVIKDPEYRKSHVKKKTDKECVIRWIREIKGEDGKVERILDQEDAYTEEDAKKAGLLSKDVWKKYQKAMLFNRCVSSGFKTYAPHLSLGYTIYTPDELDQEINQEGEMVVGKGSKLQTAPIEDAEWDITPVDDSPLTLDKVLEGSNVSKEEVAKFLGIEVSDLASPTQDELKRTKQMVEDRKKLKI